MGSRRLAAVAAAIGLLAVAVPASAHEETALHALTVIDTVTPALDDVDIRIVHLDSPALVITNDSDEVLTVLGEKGEPYLQFRPNGVWANVESPTTYRSSAPLRDVAP